jgi:hypothetical protein
MHLGAHKQSHIGMSSEMAHFALMKCNKIKHACLPHIHAHAFIHVYMYSSVYAHIHTHRLQSLRRRVTITSEALRSTIREHLTTLPADIVADASRTSTAVATVIETLYADSQSRASHSSRDPDARCGQSGKLAGVHSCSRATEALGESWSCSDCKARGGQILATAMSAATTRVASPVTEDDVIMTDVDGMRASNGVYLQSNASPSFTDVSRSESKIAASMWSTASSTKLPWPGAVLDMSAASFCVCVCSIMYVLEHSSGRSLLPELPRSTMLFMCTCLLVRAR